MQITNQSYVSSTQNESTVTPLGHDLPNTEAELFLLEKHPLLDLQIPMQMFGSQDVTKDILKCLKDEGINDDLVAVKIAHEAQDWQKIEELAHKMKGGSTFGTVRLYYALLYMERYIKAGHRHCAEQLYQQMLEVIDETLAHVEEWLSKN